MSLAALPTAVACAELFAHYTLRLEWQLPEVEPLAVQLVGELVAHAVATTGLTDAVPAWAETGRLRPIVVRLQVIEHRLLIEVADSDPDLNLSHGTGLPVVQSLCRRWSYYHTDTGGKVVWCELLLPADPNALDQTLEMARPLPRRTPGAFRGPPDPIEVMGDPGVLGHVRDALYTLDGWPEEGERR